MPSRPVFPQRKARTPDNEGGDTEPPPADEPAPTDPTFATAVVALEIVLSMTTVAASRLLLDGAGKVVRAEAGWMWARSGEQRIWMRARVTLEDDMRRKRCVTLRPSEAFLREKCVTSRADCNPRNRAPRHEAKATSLPSPARANWPRSARPPGMRQR